MPVYLCVPGSNSSEPWRHGIPVYALPFPFDASSTHSIHGSKNDTNENEDELFQNALSGNSNNMVNPNTNYNTTLPRDGNDNTNNTTATRGAAVAADRDQVQMHQYEDDNNRYTTHIPAGSPSSASRDPNQPTSTSNWDVHAVLSTSNQNSRREPIRRVKHAEIVLVDEVNAYYKNYWLRLRWPGEKGGVAGYIPLGGVDVIPVEDAEKVKERLGMSGGGGIERENFISMDEDGARGVSMSVVGSGNNNGLGRSARAGKVLKRRGDGLQRAVIADNDEGHDEQKHELVEIQSYNSDQKPEEENDELGLSDPPTDEPPNPSRMIKCESTGYYFPSSEAMKLLAQYDDGLSSAALAGGQDGNMMDDMDGGANGRGEPVFCRICRDGLHDIEYDIGTEGENKDGKKEANATVMHTATADLDTDANRIHRGFKRHSAVENTNEAPAENDTSQMPYMMQNHLLNNSLNYQYQRDKCTIIQKDNELAMGTKQPLKAEQTNHPYAENPLLSPCECSGSMAFVHYLCIEQWRNRSNHPDARNGLNCETCKAPYTLAPPPSRPEAEEDEWLEAMPAHVLAALRNPNLCWQIGAAIVRKRWLRPIAPIISSPIVALYCRARRSLKKRGVSRRRWACSLCGRRARWKCVRCLRSYYCSRQCQNVSWHIVHKHVCYKPSRFWWSVAVYGVAYVYFIPGVLSYPLIYDLGLGMLWLSFVIMGVIAGGIATILKREMGTDIRGRTLEVLVVLMTFWMALVGWGLVWSFFGVHDDDQCVGVMDKLGRLQTSIGIPSLSFFTSNSDVIHPSREQRFVQNLLLKPTKELINFADSCLTKSPSFVSKWICSPEETAADPSAQTCLELARKTNPDFMLQEFGGEKCASDFNVIIFFLYFAGFIHAFGTIWKQRRDRGRRNRHHPRPHQD